MGAWNEIQRIAQEEISPDYVYGTVTTSKGKVLSARMIVATGEIEFGINVYGYWAKVVKDSKFYMSFEG